MKFQDLKFQPYKDGVQAVCEFPNNWGASIVRHGESYGGKSGLYELAVLKNGVITATYITPKNDYGVEGWLRPEQVEDRLAKIARL